MSEAIAIMSFEEFCRFEGRGDRRSEFVGGRVFVMAGGSERHDLLAGLLYEAVAPGARNAGCRPFISNRLVRVDHAAYYPDVMVVCGPAAHRLYEERPGLVIEVLSPSTAEVDRREKALAFARSPALRAFVLADPDRRRLETARLFDDMTLQWEVYGPGDVVDLAYGVVDVDQLYDQLDSSASTA